MIPAARISATIELLDLIDSSDAPADGVIRAYFRKRRYAGSKDRRSVTTRVFDIIRHRARLDWWLASAAGEMEPNGRGRTLAGLALIDAEQSETIAALFDGQGHNPARLSDDETTLLGNIAGKPIHHDAIGEAVLCELPDFLYQPLKALWGDNCRAEMDALNAPAEVDVRVNLARVTREQARTSLARDNIETEPTPLSPVGLRLKQRGNLDATKAFRQGLIEVQDEGSQLIALLTGAKPGMTIVDSCAGAGGKTLALADAMGLQGGSEAKGRLVACDISAKRLARMDERIERAGAGAIERHVLKETGDTLSIAADRVLVDAPCSGVGAWRRHPEARWRLTPERLAELMALQDRVLDDAAKWGKPGGRLLYATCSLLPAENIDRVADFLKRHDDFQTLQISDVWTETIDTPCPSGGTALSLSPKSTGTDGFYCAVLERSA
ncbi:MAG: RsmB/NOP family class I SAM-dependent RNA methyltransferase [Rhodospirillaceae bacterium]|nr:RsmB/NOP family class I SAM-dependent RNA methyltransferase [Rhodospirillaceae bacterium]